MSDVNPLSDEEFEAVFKNAMHIVQDREGEARHFLAIIQEPEIRALQDTLKDKGINYDLASTPCLQAMEESEWCQPKAGSISRERMLDEVISAEQQYQYSMLLHLMGDSASTTPPRLMGQGKALAVLYEQAGLAGSPIIKKEYGDDITSSALVKKLEANIRTAVNGRNIAMGR